MGCTQSSSFSSDTYQPRRGKGNSFLTENQENSTEEKSLIQQKIQKQTDEDSLYLSIQEFEELYSRSGNDQNKFLSIVQEKMSNLYISLSKHTLQQLVQGNLTTTQSKLLLSSEVLYTFLKIMKAVGNKTDFAFDSKMLNMFDSAQSSMVSYMKVKYPRSAASFVPAQLTKQFKSFDLVDMPENDILTASDIHFGSEDEKVLKLQVKKFINRLIDQVDQKFIPFQKLLMEKVFVITKQGKSYTVPNKIGRKIPQNVQNLPQDDDSTLEFKSPQIFRIILKWLNNMQDYIFNPDQQTKKKQNFKTCITSQNKYIFDNISSNELQNHIPILIKYLNQFEKQYQIEIKSLKKYIELFNHNLIKILAKAQIQQKYVPKKQAQLIKYAMYNTRLLSWMLGQKLMLVMKKLIKTGQLFQTQTGVKLDLIKFNVTDLLRARMEGNKFEILQVFQNLKTLEKQNKLKIVKIKNRFETAMNDVMIIFKIEESFLICELQLLLSDGSARNEKLKHIQMLNHFFYELERSPYGVVAQVAALIGFKDNKITYEEKITFDKLKLFNIQECLKAHKSSVEEVLVQKLPFICSECSSYYDSLQNNFLYKVCKKCNQYLCSKCIINGNIKFEKDFLKQKISQKLKQELKRVSLIQEYEIRTKYTQSLKQAKFADTQFNYDKINEFFNVQNAKFIRQIAKKKSVITSKEIQKYFEQLIAKDITSKYFTLGKFLGNELVFYSLIWKRNLGIKYSFKRNQRNKLKDFDYKYNDFIIIHNEILLKDNYDDIQGNSPIILHKNYDLPENNINNLDIKYLEISKSEMKLRQCNVYLPIDIRIKNSNDGYNSQEEYLITKKEFIYESISDLRKHLPNLKQANQSYNIGNQGLEDIHLNYFKQISWKNTIKIINLYNNKINDISIILINLPNLQKLLISKNYITEINFTNKLIHFKKLVASENNLQKITQISNVPNIIDITAQKNYIEEFEFNFIFTELRIFNLTENVIKKFSSFHNKNYPKLINLSLGGQILSSQIKNKQLIFQLPSLQSLKLQRVSVQTLKLINLNNLQSLSLSQIQGYGIQFCKLPKLKKCTINKCKLPFQQYTQIKQQLSLTKLLSQDLNDLQEININLSWKIDKLPQLKFHKAKIIKIYYVPINDITNLQKCILPNLETLQLCENQITVIPIIHMKMLKNLKIIAQKLLDLSNIFKWELQQSLEIFQLGQLSHDTPIPQINNISVLNLIINGGTFAENIPFQNQRLQTLTLNSVNCSNFPQLNFQNLKTIQLNGCQSVNLNKLSTSKIPKIKQIKASNLTLKQNHQELPTINFPSLQQLNLSNCAIKSITNFSKSILPSLKTLNLNQNKILILPELNFPQLQTLFLNHCQISNMESMQKSKLPNLQKLYFNYNKIQNFPIIKCENLSMLFSIASGIINIDNLKHCKLPKLEQINLQVNKITQFPQLKCPKLTQLNIQLQKITNFINIEKSTLTSLKQLNLQRIKPSNKKLPQIDLPLLTLLNLDDSIIQDISSLTKSELPNLQEILLNRTNVKNFPKIKFSKLKFIRASSTYQNQNYDTNTGIQSIQALSQSHLPNLQILQLEYNQLKTLPKLNFPKLKTIFLKNNQITSITEFVQSYLPALNLINIYDNEINQLPFGKNLKPQSVYLNNSKIENLQILKEVGPILENFYLNNNPINQFPSGVHFTNVKILQMENCGLTDVSNIFSHEFSEATQISLASNKITTIPKIRAPKLKNLHFKNNLLTQASFLSKSQLPILDLLTLQQNKIQQINELFIPQIRLLYLSTNYLTNINFLNTNHFNKLQILVLHNLQIKSICKFNTPNLKDIYLSINQITTIDDLIGSNMPNVQKIVFNNNHITDISVLDKINFPSLTQLFLKDNKITKLPKLTKMPILNNLSLIGNPVQNIDEFLKFKLTISLFNLSVKQDQLENIKNKILKIYEYSYSWPIELYNG